MPGKSLYLLVRRAVPPGRYQEVAANLRGKEVIAEGERFVICFNPDWSPSSKR